jgi:muramoyltetrapeptide carboxypeptidase
MDHGTVIRPRHLSPNATIGIVSPASPQREPARLTRGIHYLESLGYRVKLGRNALKSHGGYLAGKDEERVADLHEMFTDSSVSAIFCARGGYGSSRLLSLIDFQIIKENPKIFVGFSDVTALQLAILRKTGLVTFTGALPSVDMADEFDNYSEEWFWRALTSTKPLGNIIQEQALSTVKAGTAIGPLIAGNLSVLVSLIGTPYLPSLEACVLAIEDVDEHTYRIDRMLTHLLNAGHLTEVSALLTGSWSQANTQRSATPNRDVGEVIHEISEFVRGPVLANLMYGHEPQKLTLPVGILAKVSSDGPIVTFVESATSE